MSENQLAWGIIRFMSDKEVVIGLLRSVEWRIRINTPKTLEAKLQLDVKLQQEALKGLDDKNRPQSEDDEEVSHASKQERSKLDYRNVESDLTPAEKDLLNQDHIPWEYRALIKSYFQALRPSIKK